MEYTNETIQEFKTAELLSSAHARGQMIILHGDITGHEYDFAVAYIADLEDRFKQLLQEKNNEIESWRKSAVNHQKK